MHTTTTAMKFTDEEITAAQDMLQRYKELQEDIYGYSSSEPTEQTMEFTAKEISALMEMMQTYKEMQEEIYGYPPENLLFTETQLRLFKRFDVVSIGKVR